MQSIQTVLNVLRDRSEAGKTVNRLYRLLSRPDLLTHCYAKIGKNYGAMTPGVTSETVDGMSRAKIELIGQTLRNERWKWKPARRTYIAKRLGGNRPLGLPTWSDKLVQEAIRVILETIYEPRFAESSFGYRPGRGCHDALWKIGQWRGTKWFVELDIKGCFDNISHEILLRQLADVIDDQKFVRLIKDMLKAGYMENWTYNRTWSGAPQGGVCSPILANVNLHELDQWVESDLIPRYTRGEKRAVNPRYSSLCGSMWYARSRKRWDVWRRLKRERSKIPAIDPNDPTYRRLTYVRYADDVLLGFAGPREEAESIKDEIKRFLHHRLHLEMSEEKTLITHAVSKPARFLGYDVRTHHDDSRRKVNGMVGFHVPWNHVRPNMMAYMRCAKPRSNVAATNCSDYEIVRRYDAVMRGLYNYYALAHDVGKWMHRVRWILCLSMLRTLAHKHRTSVRKMARKLRRFDPECGRFYELVVHRKDKPPIVATFGKYRLTRLTSPQRNVNDKLPTPLGRSDLIRRIEQPQCELCGATEELEVHHIRKMKDLFNVRTPRPAWMEAMIGRRRKTLVVCHSCHWKIHNGKYDGPKLS